VNSEYITIIIKMPMFMIVLYGTVHPVYLMNIAQAPGGRRLWTKLST